MPPVYPTRVRITPSILPNWESGPQNQPSAKVAVFTVDGVFVSIGGTLLRIAPADISMVLLPSYPWIVRYCPATIVRDMVKKNIIMKSLIACIVPCNAVFSVYQFIHTPILTKKTEILSISLFFKLFLWNKTESG